MKQYKLLKKYPSLPIDWEIGMIIGLGDRNFGYAPCNGKYTDKKIDNTEIQNGVGFWEEVVDKEYEIMSVIDNRNEIWTKEGNSNTFFAHGQWVSERIAKTYRIHSVKRLSDGEVFTLGEFVNFGDNEIYKITSFGNYKDDETNFWAFFNDKKGYGSNLSGIKKQQSLFTTSDGKEIYKGDEFFVVDKKFDSYKIHQTIGGHFTKEHPCRLRFSSKALAESYVLMNKPCFSINDIININPYMAMQIEKFREIAKSKISNL